MMNEILTKSHVSKNRYNYNFLRQFHKNYTYLSDTVLLLPYNIKHRCINTQHMHIYD